VSNICVVCRKPRSRLRESSDFYAFYDVDNGLFEVKICLVGVKSIEAEELLNLMIHQGAIKRFWLKVEETTLDISKIMACASRKISDILRERNALTEDLVVAELLDQEISHDSYHPLHFICNQLSLLPQELSIKTKLNEKTHKNKGIESIKYFFLKNRNLFNLTFSSTSHVQKSQ